MISSSWRYTVDMYMCVCNMSLICYLYLTKFEYFVAAAAVRSQHSGNWPIHLFSPRLTYFFPLHKS